MKPYISTAIDDRNDTYWNTWAKNFYRGGGNSTAQLVHIEKTSDGYYMGWCLYSNYPTAVDENEVVGGSDGKSGVIVLPATSTLGDGTDAVLSTYPNKANASISLNGLSWSVTSTDNSSTFTIPPTKITSSDITNPIKSPTVWYSLPFNNSNVGYTIKVSYKYGGVKIESAVFENPRKRKKL
jgi:hypothetical protein